MLVEKVRGHDYGKPLSYMRSYLEAMDSAPFNAVGPAEPPERVLAALGPKMLELSATQANGAHPYLTTPEHTRMAREVLGPDVLLAPEQMVVLEPIRPAARPSGGPRSASTCVHPATWPTSGVSVSPTMTGRIRSRPRTVSSTASSLGVASRRRPRIHEHHDAGADHVAVQVLGGDQPPMRQWQELAQALL